MQSKAKGSRSERKVRDQLLADGWYVTKAGGSLGIWDLVALHPDGPVRLVQVKTNRMPRNEEMKTLEEFAVKFPHVQCFVALVRDRRDTLWKVLASSTATDTNNTLDPDISLFSRTG